MRITPNMTANNALYNIQNSRSRLDSLNERIASGMNINRPSDDPISTRNILDLENVVKQSYQYTSNIEKANIWLNITDTALTGMTDTVEAIRKIVGTVVGGTDNSAEGQRLRAVAVSQLQEMQKQLVDLGNTQLGDQYIFAGFQDSTKPFTLTPGAPPVLPYLYNGDSGIKNIDITKTSSIGMNVDGDAVLMGTRNGVPPGPYGSINILDTLEDIITEIQNNTDLPLVQSLAGTLDDSIGQLNNARGDVASKLIRLETTKNMLARDKTMMLGIISDRQNVDYAKAATEMNQEKTAFEAALSVTAQISQLSLLDYI